MSPLATAEQPSGRIKNADERGYPQMNADGSCPSAARATTQRVIAAIPNGATPICVHLRADSDDVAHAFRSDVAHRSDLKSPSVPA
jgi:hypothetical protein